jgi:hypothetical protein
VSSYTVRITKHTKGGDATPIDVVSIDSLDAAIQAANTWQKEFDLEGTPARVYVLDPQGVAVYAGGARAAKTSHEHACGP